MGRRETTKTIIRWHVCKDMGESIYACLNGTSRTAKRPNMRNHEPPPLVRGELMVPRSLVLEPHPRSGVAHHVEHGGHTQSGGLAEVVSAPDVGVAVDEAWQEGLPSAVNDRCAPGQRRRRADEDDAPAREPD